MLINFNNSSYLYNYQKDNGITKNYSFDKPNFKSNTPQKLIEKIFTTNDLKSIKLTFDEISKIYKHLGFDIVFKRGSHAIVHLPDNKNLPLVIPHKDKCVHPHDIKRLKLVMQGKIDEALSYH